LENINITTFRRLKDTEDWSDAENAALHHINKLYFKVYLKENITLF